MDGGRKRGEKPGVSRRGFITSMGAGVVGTAALGARRAEAAAPTVAAGDTVTLSLEVNGETRYACMTLALEAEGTQVTTVEGLLDGEALGPVQQAFVEKDGFQCGFCTSGQVMAVEGLLRKKKDPTPEEIREGLSGNLCRCGAYAHIVESARRAGEMKRGGGR
jgi:xanthine dehydrogenase YagT iron-sulfur-binding subunit